MNNIREVLRDFDIFSVPFTPSMNTNNQFQYKSVTGGSVSIIVILLSFVYTIYQIILWQTDQFLPKVTSQFTKISPEQTLMKNQIRVHVQSTGYNEDGSPTVDPFDPNAIIYYPIISLDVENYNNYLDYTPYYSDGKLNISLVFYNESQPVITFIKCQEQFLKENQKCGSEAQRAQFEAQSGNQFYITVLFQLLNPDNFDIQTVGRTYSILIENDVCTIDTLYLQLTKYDVDRGALLKQSEEYYLYTDGEMDSGRASQTYCGKLWLPQTAGVIWLIQEKQVKTERMVYPKIGEVFAQIGSIVSLLFLTRYAIYQLNDSRMKNWMLDFLIGSYYPEIQLFKVKVNWRKKTQSVTYKNNKVNVKSYDEFIAKKRKEIECKLNFTNLVYEISKIQVVLKDQLGRECLEKYLKLGIKLNLQKHEDEIMLSSSKMINNEEEIHFEDQDILLFSIRNSLKQGDVEQCAIS